MDRRGVHVRVLVVVPQPLLAREPCARDTADRGPPIPVVAFGEQQLREEPLVGELLLLSGPRGFLKNRPGGGKSEAAAGCVLDREDGLTGPRSSAMRRYPAARLVPFVRDTSRIAGWTCYRWRACVAALMR